MDLAGKILSDTPFKEVNLLNELDHMENSCGQTDASTSIAVPCLCQERVPNAGPLWEQTGLCRDTGRWHWVLVLLPVPWQGTCQGKEAEEKLCRQLGKLGQKWKVFCCIVFVTMLNFFKMLFCTVQQSKCSNTDTSSTLNFFCNYQDDVH